MKFNIVFQRGLGLIFLVLQIKFSRSTLTYNLEPDKNEHPAVTKFRNYLRIRTDHPNPKSGYEKAIKWLKNQAIEIGLEYREVKLGPENDDNIVLTITWKGTVPALKSILFNGHMDVVAVEPDQWKYPPFDACKDKNGDIYARGAADMKSNTVGILEAIRELKQAGFRPFRTIHLTLVPDEEYGGLKGMKPFIELGHFIKLNVGLAIDECGGNGQRDTMRICYAEKNSWQFKITAKGVIAHSASFPEFTAANRIQVVVDKLLEFRRQQFEWLNEPGVYSENVTSINLVGLGGGIANNIIAGELWAAFDMRIKQNSSWTFEKVDKFLENVLREARLGAKDEDSVSIKFSLKSMETGKTVVNGSNVWWTRIQNICKESNIYCPASFISATSDARYVRQLGIPAFGISPFFNSRMTAHQPNEFINEFEFLNGIKRYSNLIRGLTMCPKSGIDLL